MKVNKLREIRIIEDFKKVERFVLRMKAKKYMADVVDLYRLVDVWDVVQPGKLNIPHSSTYKFDVEKSITVMFEEVARWYVKQKNIKQPLTRKEISKRYYEKKKRMKNV